LASLAPDIRFPALRVIMAASEKLYAQDVVRAARHLEGDWRIVHQLASTETGFIAAQVFTSSHLPEAGVVPVGRPVKGTEVTIETEAGERVRPGEIGEIVVRNQFLAPGYWNNPELTAKAFRSDPFDNSVRIYRTGDLGRLRLDGILEHWGRIDRRLKVRGFTIEPFQVESALMQLDGISDAAVVLRQDGHDESSLIGYVVAPPQTSPSS